MSGTKEIKTRIESVKSTRKITNAMYLIASTKLQKAKGELLNTRPYFDALRHEIKRIFRTVGDVESKYFFPADGSQAPDGTYAVLVITADKGLAGAYNQNVIREAERLLGEHPDTKLFVVGEYGRRAFMQKHIPIEKSFLYTAQNPTLHRAREISTLLLGLFDRHEADRIFVVYTDFKNSRQVEAVSTRLLPFHRQQFTADGGETFSLTQFTFEPSVSAVLDSVMESYVTGFIYSALVYSFCSEQNARMDAMDAANRNAEEILDSLTVQYNRVRQGTITQEITEVSSGARAQGSERERQA